MSQQPTHPGTPGTPEQHEQHGHPSHHGADPSPTASPAEDGRRPLDDALAAGELRVEGDTDVVRRLLGALVPPVPA